jgi:hypothetical protein
MGGESLIYDELGEYLDHIGTCYGSRIFNIQLVTNGSITPELGLLQVLKRHNVSVEVSDYSPAGLGTYPQRLQKTIDALEAAGVRYRFKPMGPWLKMYPDGKEAVVVDSRALKRHYDRCLESFRCPAYIDGHLYPCQQMWAAKKRGRPQDAANEGLDLKRLKHDSAADRFTLIRTVALGYSETGPPALCRYCYGRDDASGSGREVPPALQLRANNN